MRKSAWVDEVKRLGEALLFGAWFFSFYFTLLMLGFGLALMYAPEAKLLLDSPLGPWDLVFAGGAFVVAMFFHPLGKSTKGRSYQRRFPQLLCELWLGTCYRLSSFAWFFVWIMLLLIIGGILWGGKLRWFFERDLSLLFPFLAFILVGAAIADFLRPHRTWRRRYLWLFACLFAIVWEPGTRLLFYHRKVLPSTSGIIVILFAWPALLYWLLDTVTARWLRVGWRTPVESDHPVLSRLEEVRIRKSMSRERFANEVIRIPYATYDHWIKGGFSKLSTERLRELEKLASQLEAELGDKND
jgi:hypothetical protein